MEQKLYPRLIPTKDKSNFYLHEGKLKWSDEPFINGVTNTQNQFLHMCSIDGIEEEDWFIWDNQILRCKYILGRDDEHPSIYCDKDIEHFSFDCQKIIATMDRELTYYVGDDFRGREYDAQYQLPSIPQPFISTFMTEYNKGNIIKEVMAEYHRYPFIDARIPDAYFPKLNGNEIIIK